MPRKLWLPILALSWMVLAIPLRAESTPPQTPGETPDAPPPSTTSTLYTRAEVLQAVDLAVDAALAKAIPLVVQAAVAEKEGQLAAKDAELENERADRKTAEGQAGRLTFWAKLSGWLIAAGTLAGTIFGLWVSSFLRN